MSFLVCKTLFQSDEKEGKRQESVLVDQKGIQLESKPKLVKITKTLESFLHRNGIKLYFQKGVSTYLRN